MYTKVFPSALFTLHSLPAESYRYAIYCFTCESSGSLSGNPLTSHVILESHKTRRRSRW